jgi:hypothetical protein
VQRDLHITDYFDMAGNHFRNYPANCSRAVFTARPGRSNAGTPKLRRGDLRRSASFEYCLVERFSRSFFSHASDVARSRNGRT